MNRRRALVLGGIAAAAAGLVAAPRLWHEAMRDDAWLHEASFEDLSGRRRRLSEWQGRPLILNFWATWCAPCREEIPLLMAMRRKHGPRGLEVVGLAIDLAAKVSDYARTMAIDYPVLLANGAGLELMRRLGNAGGVLPYTVFVGRRGELARRKLGAFSQAELEEAVAQVLG